MGSPKWFMKHCEENNKQFAEIKDELKIIRENHLSHIQTAITELSTNYTWIKWFVVLIVAGLLGLAFK